MASIGGPFAHSHQAYSNKVLEGTSATLDVVNLVSVLSVEAVFFVAP